MKIRKRQRFARAKRRGISHVRCFRFPEEMGLQEHQGDHYRHTRRYAYCGAAIRDDTLTAGRLAEECLWEAQREDLSEAEVTAAAGGNLLAFMISELNRAAERGDSR